MIESALFGSYLAACACLALFGLHRTWLLIAFWRMRRRGPAPVPVPAPALDDDLLPFVAVQLPIYNEKHVCVRAIDALCQLDYPRARLDLQVLDDSDDETSAAIDICVAAWRARGVPVRVCRRAARTGYKAGALAEGLAQTRADFIAIFDADFVPRPRFLREVMPWFGDARVAMVQARWGHLNPDTNWLTRAQRIFLDAHFTVDHAVRSGAGRWFNFNGTAGVWRRQAIEAAGGWDAATLTEDLDLSFRAQMRGARFTYVDHVEVPAELPESVSAFRSQQHRWAKGSMQSARRLLPGVWRSRATWSTRLDASLKLGQNLAFLLLAWIVALAPWVAVRHPGQPWRPLSPHGLLPLLGASLPVAVYFVTAQRHRGRGTLAALLSVPMAFGLGAALSLHNGRAVLEGLLGREGGEFVRTPKRGASAESSYAPRPVRLAWLEVGVGLVHVGAACALTLEGRLADTLFLWLCGPSLLWLGVAGMREVWAPTPSRGTRRSPQPPQLSQPPQPPQPPCPADAEAAEERCDPDHAGPEGFMPLPLCGGGEGALVEQRSRGRAPPPPHAAEPSRGGQSPHQVPGVQRGSQEPEARQGP